jgi:quinol monooxygenase YgiN
MMPTNDDREIVSIAVVSISIMLMLMPTIVSTLTIALFLLSTLTIIKTTALSIMSSKPFCLNVRLDVKPERRDEFLKVIQHDGKSTVANELDALQFVVGEDVDSTNTFYLHEQYKSEDAFTYHTQTPHYAKWQTFCNSDPFVKDPVVDMYHGTHDEETKIPMRAAFCLNVELNIQPHVREEFLKVIDNNQKGSNAEPLCLQYHYGESTTTPNAFFFHEEYIGQDDGRQGLEAHQAAPHFAVWEHFASTGEPFTKPPTVSLYKSLIFE